MNYQFDPFETCLALMGQLRPADEIRLIDHLLARRGPSAPIPELDNIKEDAQAWVGNQDSQTTIIYLVEIWRSLSAKRQRAAVKFFQDNVKDGGDD